MSQSVIKVIETRTEPDGRFGRGGEGVLHDLKAMG